MTRPTRSVRLPVDVVTRVRALAVALTAIEGRIVTEADVRARAVDAGLRVVAADVVAAGGKIPA